MSSRKDRARDQYEKAAHRMQSAEAVMDGSDGQSPKHLRVGVNVALSDHGSLVRLCIRKGLFTEEEYVEAIAEGMEAEGRRRRPSVPASIAIWIRRR